MNSNGDFLVVTGLGMRCSIGQNVIQSCAAVRANINRFGEWPYFGMSFGEEDAVLVAASVTPDLGDRSWIEKFEELTTQPLMEALWMAKLYQLTNVDELTRWGTYLACPSENRFGVDQEDKVEFAEDVQDHILFPVESNTLLLFPKDHCGALLAMEKAMSDLIQGHLDICVVGGVDSLLHGEYLRWLLDEGKLKTPLSPSGLIPGEAAAFAVIETREHAQTRGAKILAQITPISTAFEPNSASGKPNTGDALAQALHYTLKNVPCEPKRICRVVNDLNGERSRFLEWSMANRALKELPPDWRFWHPADCFGDIGAATGVAHLCIAARAFERNYAVGDAIIICNSSDSGERTATCVLPTPQSTAKEN